MTVTPIGEGLYRVDDGTRRWMVAVAGPPDNRWVWVEGHVWQLAPPAGGNTRRRGRSSGGDLTALTAPMPATVLRVNVDAGTRVARGDTLIMLEAMKMELPIKAPHDGVVKAVHCQAGELVQPGVNLLDFE